MTDQAEQASKSSHNLTINPLAEFKPSSSSRAWVSYPNPNDLPLLATATSDKTVRVYSLKNFTLHSVLEGGHTRSVRSVAWQPRAGRRDNGTLTLATGSFDATMGIWRRREETQSGEDGVVIEGEDGEPVEFNAMGTAKRSRDDDSDASNEDDWEFAIVLEGHDSEIKTVAYSPSGQYLASCSRDKSIWIWEEIGEEGDDEFETIAVLQEHTADVKCVAWRKDDGNGEVLASASYDDTVRLWRGDDEGEWSCVGVLEGHKGTVWALEWEPEVSMNKFSEPLEEGKEKDYSPRIPRIMSSSADNTIRIWSQVPAPPPPNRPSYFNSGIPSTMRPAPSEETWETTAILPKAHTLPIYSIQWSAKTGRVVSTGGDGKVVIYEEVVKGRSSVGGPIEREWVVVGEKEGAHGPYEVNHVTWSGRWDGGRKGEEEMIVSTGDDGVVRAWVIENLVN